MFYRKLILDIKIYVRINYRYKKMFPNSRISSLLSPDVEKKIQKGTVIEEQISISPTIKQMGRYIYIGKNTTISNCSEIGSFTSISSGVKIGLMVHPQDYISTSPIFYAVRRGFVKLDTFDETEGKTTVIGHDVLISANAMIKNGITIGHGAIIGAGSFVDKDVPPYAIVVGTPAKILRFRFEEKIIVQLLESQWWKCSDEIINEAGNFNNPIKFLLSIAQKNNG